MFKIICLIMLSNSSVITLFTARQDKPTKNWQIVNDGVMRGRSEGSFEMIKKDYLHFYGKVSLKNNGGFSSIRYALKTLEATGNDFIRLTVQGDGKKYQFRIITKENPNFSYVTYFQTKENLETIDISLNKMYPAFRGRNLNLPNFEKGELKELGILIGNKKEESFNLKIQKIEIKRG